MKTSSAHQKRYLLSIIERLCNDSRCIIEFYLNYDCDSNMPNICEKLIDYLTKLSLQRVEVTPQQNMPIVKTEEMEYLFTTSIKFQTSPVKLCPQDHLSQRSIVNSLGVCIKMTSIGCAVAFLRSLYSWAQRGLTNANSKQFTIDNNNKSLSSLRNRSDSTNTSISASRNHSFVNGDSLTDSDNPQQFENQKQRKKAFLEGVRQFNQKAKKGCATLLIMGLLLQMIQRILPNFF